MTRERSSHEQKTLFERQAYFETTIRGPSPPSPTVDERTEELDSTETTLAQKTEPTRPYRRTKKRNRSLVWLREHWARWVVGIILVPLTGWILLELYSLNREVGELRTQLNGNSKTQEEYKTDFDRFREDMRQELDRINDRLDHISQTH